jgi:pimeloyl-ACP methyl ester carboxylesterase
VVLAPTGSEGELREFAGGEQALVEGADDGIAQDFVVVLLQPRGVSSNGTVDQEGLRQYETRQRRVADQIAVMDAYLADSGSVPVLLVGPSQGGVVAADVAAREPKEPQP